MVPLLRLRGRWLKELGFAAGSQVAVSASPGRPVITVVSSRGGPFGSVPVSRRPGAVAGDPAGEKPLALSRETAYFELTWKPKSWARRSRFLVIRSQRAVQRSGPLQLDLFIPQVAGFEFKVIVTNKRISARHVVAYHEGRGTQEAIFAGLKSQGPMDCIPVRKLMGNQTFLLAVIFAHSLDRELQMQTRPVQRQTTEKPAPLWIFEQLNTLRKRLIQQAGCLTRPQGRLTLTLGTSPVIKEEFLGYLGHLQAAY
ncbi:MAG: type I addiction module toxin, SymE family [Thermoanaerobaculia bacterium]|nr:type I addiction module toxin, SymE family [Thermoanaerobaculia bacterium]